MKEKLLPTPKMFSRTLPVLLSGAWIVFQVIVSADSSFGLFQLFLGMIIIIFIIASLITYIQDIRKYLATKSLLSFLPTITSILFIIAFITINYVLAVRDFSPVIIKAKYQGNYGTQTISFREDGTYKLTNDFLGDESSRGTYQLKDSLITLDGNIDSNIIGRNLIIRDRISLDNVERATIYKANNQNQIVDKDFAFIVIEDHRLIKSMYGIFPRH